MRQALLGLIPALVLLALSARSGRAADEVVLLDTNNKASVEQGPAAPAILRLDRPCRITSIRTYHWNAGRGAASGRMVIDDPRARVTYGPWTTKAEGPRPRGNALYFLCRPSLRLEAGTYELRAVDPATWSQNAASGHRGMCVVRGVPLTESPPTDAPPPEPVPPAASPFRLTPLAQAALQPSDTAQVVTAGPDLRVILPPAVLRDGGRIEVSSATVTRPDRCGVFDVLGLFDVSIGDRHEFSEDIVLECRYDPTKIDPAESPIVAVRWDPDRRLWVELPCKVDAARGVIVTRTRHLSIGGWIRRVVIAAMDPIDRLTHQVIRVQKFRFYYDLDELRASKVTRNWRGTRSVPAGYEHLWEFVHPAWTPFMRDVAYFLERSHDAYDIVQLTPLPEVPICVDVGPGGREGVPAEFEHRTRRLSVFSDKIRADAKRLKQVLAHELFHAIQNEDLGGDEDKIVAQNALWWIESTAEYGACRVAWQLDSMGGGSRDSVYPYLLERPLTEAGRPVCPHGTKEVDDIEYDKGYFLDYLAGRGYAFAPMYKAVTAAYGKGSGTLPPLEAYVRTTAGKAELGSLFREYAGWFLFASDAPRGLCEESDPLRSADNAGGKAEMIQAVEEPPTLAHDFALPAPYTAVTWAVRAESLGRGITRDIAVRATSLDPGSVVDLYVLPDGARRKRPRPIATLDEERRIVPSIRLEARHTLYVTAVNLDAERAARVTIAIRPKPREAPPAGLLTHEESSAGRRLRYTYYRVGAEGLPANAAATPAPGFMPSPLLASVVLHGAYEVTHEKSGTMLEEGRYEYGLPRGVFTTRDTDGRKTGVRTYSGGRLLHEKRYPRVEEEVTVQYEHVPTPQGITTTATLVHEHERDGPLMKVGFIEVEKTGATVKAGKRHGTYEERRYGPGRGQAERPLAFVRKGRYERGKEEGEWSLETFGLRGDPTGLASESRTQWKGGRWTRRVAIDYAPSGWKRSRVTSTVDRETGTIRERRVEYDKDGAVTSDRTTSR